MKKRYKMTEHNLRNIIREAVQDILTDGEDKTLQDGWDEIDDMYSLPDPDYMDDINDLEANYNINGSNDLNDPYNSGSLAMMAQSDDPLERGYGRNTASTPAQTLNNIHNSETKLGESLRRVVRESLRKILKENNEDIKREISNAHDGYVQAINSLERIAEMANDSQLKSTVYNVIDNTREVARRMRDVQMCLRKL